MSSFPRLLLLSATVAVLCAPVVRAQDAAPESPPESKSYDDSARSGSFLSGRFARLQGDRANAAHYLEKALEKDPENVGILSQLLVLSLARGDMAGAVERARVLEARPEHEPLADLVLAIDAVKLGDMDAASTRFAKVFANNKRALWEPLFTAWVDYGRGKLKKPVQPSDILPKGQNAPAFLAYQLALINDIAGFTSMAQRQYELALLDHSKVPFRAVEAAADFYRRQGDEEKLAQLKIDYLNANPNASALVDTETAANVATLMDQSVGAERDERLVDSVAEGIAEVLFTMASVLYSVDAQQDTMIYLRMALSLRPDFPLAQLLLANVLEDEKRFAEAEEVYRGVNSKGPLGERALLRRAYMIERQGHLEQAIAMLDEQADANPEDYDAYVAKGDLLRARQRFGEAAAAYTQALSRIPETQERNWAIYFARGACYERAGDWKRAEADLRQALDLNPDHPEVLNYLGYGLLTRDENAEEAKELIGQAYNLQPGAPHIMDSMGWALYRSGDFTGARDLLEQAIELMPSDATVNDHLGDVYWQTGRKTEARYQWERALTFSPDAAQEKELRRKLQFGLPPLQVQEKLPEKPVAESPEDVPEDAAQDSLVDSGEETGSPAPDAAAAPVKKGESSEPGDETVR